MKRLSKGAFRIVIGIMIIAVAITVTTAIDSDKTIPVTQLSAIDPDSGNIASGQTIIGNIDPVGDTDAFTFYGKAGQIVVIEAAPINNYNVAPKIDLYNQSGYLETSCNGYYRCRVENYKLKQTGIYTIITASKSTLAGKYGISLVIIPGASSSKQDIDGGDIVSGYTYQGNISINGDTDMFTFYGKKGEGIVLEMTTKNYGYLRMDLYNSSGLETKMSQYQNRIRIENYILKQTGIYTVIPSDSYTGWSSTFDKYNMSFIKIPSTTHGISNINPPDKSTVTDLNQYFKWGIEGNIAAKYDVYFGEDVITSLNKIGNNITLKELKFPTMQYGKIYYWHVETKTSTGTIQSPYWWFTTKNPIGCTVSTIYGYKFNDANSNKTRDVGEVGISDWVMNLKGYDTCTGKLVSRTTTTNNTGYYRFGTVNAGTYIVYEDFVLGWLPTTSAAYTVTIPSTSTSIKRDFGNKK